MTNPMTSLRPRPPGEGATYTLGPDRIEFVLGDDTGGAFALGLVTCAPGGGPPPHVHRREDEVVLVLRGEPELWTPVGTMPAWAGATAFLPADAPHTYCNASGERTQCYLLTNPAGFEIFCAEFSRLFEIPGGPAPAQVAAVAERPGIRFVAP